MQMVIGQGLPVRLNSRTTRYRTIQSKSISVFSHTKQTESFQTKPLLFSSQWKYPRTFQGVAFLSLYLGLGCLVSCFILPPPWNVFPSSQETDASLQSIIPPAPLQAPPIISPVCNTWLVDSNICWLEYLILFQSLKLLADLSERIILK